ncbi:hypothetical protein GCM10018791_50970 [Streptomyces zaomyceticus]|nr:hypothetical protein GCM10018791_50970 [Streptomyces zaomyceticus]
MPRASKASVPTRARNTKSAIEAILDAATELRPTPGYINGTDYADWSVEATPGLLRALADLAQHHEESELAEDLRRFSGPMCLEPLYDDPSKNRSPRSFCAEIVASEGGPARNTALRMQMPWADASTPTGEGCAGSLAYMERIGAPGTWSGASWSSWTARCAVGGPVEFRSTSGLLRRQRGRLRQFLHRRNASQAGWC